MTSYLARVRNSRPCRWGALLFAIGCGPLLAIIAFASLGLTSDPNPNPIGPGMLAFFTFWPSVILIAVGLVTSIPKRRQS